MSTEAKPHNSNGRGHEERDVAFKYVAGAGIGMIVLIIISVSGMRLLFDYYLAREIRLSPAANPLAASRPKEPPAPRLLPKPIEQLRRLRSEENVTLESYGWVDRSQGIVRIPIDRAMELVAERGLR